MGAAGSVTIYRRSDVESAYERLWPGESLTEDWDYVDTITAELDGERWIIDYADDQGWQEGSRNSFWFGGEGAPVAQTGGRVSMRVLNLFCGAGGCSVGYERGFREAGFDVEIVGVDLHPQPNYPYEFVQADALTFPLDEFDLIHASPPCKAHTKTGWAYYRGYHDHHEDLLTPTRERLSRLSTPYVLENVPGAPMVPDVVLCGSQFGLNVRRHRWFETRPRLFTLMQPCVHTERVVSPHGNPNRFKGSARAWAAAMGIDWMAGPELAQAIPPAYTQYIAVQLVPHLAEVAA